MLRFILCIILKMEVRSKSIDSLQLLDLAFVFLNACADELLCFSEELKTRILQMWEFSLTRFATYPLHINRVV